MWLKKIHPGIAVSLLVCGALMLTGGVSELMVEPKPFPVSEPKSLVVSEPKKMGVSQPRKQSEFKPRPFKHGSLSEGKYTAGQKENAEYARCAKLKGFDARRKCALEALSGN